MIEILLQAERALAMGMLDQAERMYRQAAGADPRNSIAVVGLARVALERGDEPASWRFAKRALEIDPENVAGQRLAERLEEVWAYRGRSLPAVAMAEVADAAEVAQVAPVAGVTGVTTPDVVTMPADDAPPAPEPIAAEPVAAEPATAEPAVAAEPVAAEPAAAPAPAPATPPPAHPGVLNRLLRRNRP